MIKCRISNYNDKIFIDNTTSSKLNYMKEGFFITKEELEQLQREFYQAGQDSIVLVERTSYSEYLSSKSKEKAE